MSVGTNGDAARVGQGVVTQRDLEKLRDREPTSVAVLRSVLQRQGRDERCCSFLSQAEEDSGRPSHVRGARLVEFRFRL